MPATFPTLPTLSIAILSAACLVLAGCNRQAGAAPGGPPPAAPVDVAAAVQRTLPQVEEFTGRLESADLVEVRSRIAGAIERVHVADGAAVARGALLFTIDPRPYQAEAARAEAQLATARAQARLAQSELQRAQALLPQQAISKAEADQLAAAAETAAAAVQQADAALRAARLNLEYTSVRAPVAGRVSRIDATAGNFVNDSRVLTTLAGTAKLYAYFDVSEGSYLRLRKAPAAQRTVQMGLADEPALPRQGRVDFIDNRLNPQTATIRLRAAFDNPDGALLPGLFTKLRLATSAPRPVVLTPDRAIATDQDRRFVWVVGANNVPMPRPVVPGALVGGMRVVESGLQAGETVVVGGLQRVRPGAPVSPNKVPVDADGMPLPPPPPGQSAAAAPAAPAQASAPAAGASK